MLRKTQFGRKMLFFEMLGDLKLADKIAPWFSQVRPRPIYSSPDAEAFWDVPVYGDHTFVRSNRVDARFVDHKSKKVLMVKMSCPWLDKRNKKETEKTEKYGTLRLELSTPRIQDHTIECHHGFT